MSSIPEGEQPKKRRRPHLASMQWERRFYLLAALLERYADDEQFGDEVLALYEQHRDAISLLVGWASFDLWRAREVGWRSAPVNAYCDAIDPRSDGEGEIVGGFAARWGLDGVPDGVEAVHRWCTWHHQRPQDGVSTFRIGIGAGGNRPDPDGALRLAVEIAWDASGERRALARARILAECERQVDSELDRIAAAYEQAGYQFPDSQPKLSAYLDWLYWRVAYRKSADVIACELQLQGEEVAESTVLKRTGELARELGIKIPRAGERPV